jgi:hypothetical protein
MVVSIRLLVATGATAAICAAQSVTITHRQLQSSLAEAPSVKLHVTFKRKTMKLHGQSEFDIYAAPVVSDNGDSVLYDSYATFTDDDAEYRYTLADGAAYLTTRDSSDAETVQCLPPHTLPFDEILPALNNAVPIPSASIGNNPIDCTSGNLFKTTFAGAHYAICSMGEAGFTAHSSDVGVKVEYLDGPVSVETPELPSGSACQPLVEASSLTPTAVALATGGQPLSATSRMLEAAEHMALDSTVCETCLSTPRPCIFLHGLGNPTEEPELQDTPKLTKNKFGDMHSHAPCCSTIKYAVLNTVDAGWRNETLQEKFCNFSLSMSETSDVPAGIIDNTIVVTHSMGGLVMAHALARGKCSFSTTTSWVALSPPMTGSMASDFLQDICNDEESNFAAGLFEVLGQCPMPTSRKSTIYQGGNYSTPSIDAAYTAAQEAYRGNVTAAMCSNSYKGLLSVYQASPKHPCRYRSPAQVQGE